MDFDAAVDDASHIAIDALRKAPFAIVITNPALEDNPIVYVNRAFQEATGYSADGAVGRNCRFLQGEKTDPDTVRILREAVIGRDDASVEILNYRADGTPYWARVMISPLEVGEDHSPYFMGVLIGLDHPPGETNTRPRNSDEVDRALMEIQHRVKNHLSMIVGMIRMQAREGTSQDDFQALARRIEALQLLYEELNSSDGKTGRGDDTIALGAYLSRISSAIAHIDGRHGVRVNVNADEISVRFDTATRLGLVVSEILTNAMQHAFEGRESGLVEVSVTELKDGAIRIKIADDGIGLPDDVDWPRDGNLGSKIVRQLVAGLESKIVIDRAEQGTTVLLDVPPTQRD